MNFPENFRNRSAFFYGRVAFSILGALFIVLLAFKQNTLVLALISLGLADIMHAFDARLQHDKSKAIGSGIFGVIFLALALFVAMK
ncbi:MAG: hypothetical protein ACE3JP_03775 [Ectobacillus sp.]